MSSRPFVAVNGTRVPRAFILVVMILLCLPSARSQDEKKTAAKIKSEAPSPDGRFAFRYSGDPNSVTSEDAEPLTYDLVEKKSGKVLMSVVESGEDIGPSARFNMKVLWRPDSKAFAITAFLWKRGSEVIVYRTDGSAFHKIEMPELEAEAPDEEKKGKEFPHAVEMSSQTAKRWQKDGSLMVDVESMSDGDGYSMTVLRKVVLGFDHSEKAKIVSSTVKCKMEKQ